MTDQTALLVMNVGTSTIKYAAYAWDGALACLLKKKCFWRPDQENFADVLDDILDQLRRHNIKPAKMVHRVVHGGHEEKHALKYDEKVDQLIEKFSSYAPLHQPVQLQALRRMASLAPEIEQYVCVDTAFHMTIDRARKTYAIPEKFSNAGLHRYGFHGLSYQYLAGQVQRFGNYSRVVAAHLGSGVSLCALLNGQSIDTTMGLTALAGMPMATRSGDVDPGLVISLIRQWAMSPDDVEKMLYQESGLLALSGGLSSDMKVLLESPLEQAQQAVDYFCWRLAQGVACMAVSLGGAEAIVFTGGVGENAPRVREKIMQSLMFMGKIPHFVLPADEEVMMAQNVWKVAHG
ncbi:MAG: hypothetical protein EBQ89_09215 [Alphaproteobacteria bacterium]|nr:hypothetical protein [Alphaproteobacteria bacterium]